MLPEFTVMWADLRRWHASLQAMVVATAFRRRLFALVEAGKPGRSAIIR